MARDRYLTVHFNDGSKLFFDFPEQTASVAARQIKISEFLTSKHLVVEAEGSVLLIPVTSIKYIAVNADTVSGKALALPKHAILGAHIRS